MIKEITLDCIATFSEEAKIENIKEINFFYGANGSGKTTISKIIANPENYPKCKIEWDNGREMKRLVFNEDFIREYFYNSPYLKGIYTIGEGAKKIGEEIDKKKKQIDNIENEINNSSEFLNTKNTELANIESCFENKCWEDIYKKYQSKFGEIFVGYMKNKKKFAENLLNHYEKNKSDLSNLKELIDLEEKYNLLYREEAIILDEIDNISCKINEVSQKLKDIETSHILQEKIIGKQDIDIAAMIQKLQNQDWVKKGQEYYYKNYDETQNAYICPFCQQRTDEYFRKQLEDYFDETYNNKLEELQKLMSNYKSITKEITTIFHELDSITYNKYLEEKTESINDKKEIINKIIDNNNVELNRKLENPSIQINLSQSEKYLKELKEIIDNINSKIKAHNKLIKNKEKSKEQLKTEIWKYFCNEINITICNYKKDKENIIKCINGIRNRINKGEEIIKNLKNEIKELEKQIKSVKPTVDAINGLLQKFGFTGFRLMAVDDKHYQIIRCDGSPAKETLSEGERNFIVFLYFYYLIQGVLDENESINENKIVVFDDPVSSLDSNVLFIISTLIRHILCKVRQGEGNIKQIFILTHNAYFFKEITYLPIQESKRKEYSYYIVKKQNNVSGIKWYEKNPIKSTYQLLWDEIKNGTDISVPNAMRRIIEFYFKILGNDYSDNVILEKFDDPNEKLICKTLLSWLNVNSHEVFDDVNFSLINEDLEKYRQVFKKIFEETGHLQHYKMMMGEN